MARQAVTVDAFPIGIDPRRFRSALQQPRAQANPPREAKPPWVAKYLAMRNRAHSTLVHSLAIYAQHAGSSPTSHRSRTKYFAPAHVGSRLDGRSGSTS